MAFQAIMKYGNMTKAAESLFISQPALSTRLVGLENELGCRLFLRRRGVKNIELTEKGKQFIALAERWNGVCTEIRALSDNSEFPPIRISSVNSISSAILPQAMSLFMHRQPKLSLQVEDLGSYASYDAIESRRLDLAIIIDQRYSLKAICKPLFSDPLLLICNSSSKLPPLVRTDDLDPRNEVYSPWSLEFEQWHNSCFGNNVKPKILIQIMSHLAYFLREPDSWSIVPATVAHLLLNENVLAARTLKPSPPDRVVCRLEPDTGPSPQVSEFISCLTSILCELEQQQLLRTARLPA